MTHHPHVHCIFPGGGFDNAKQWKGCKKGFFLPVRVLSRLFRRLYMQGVAELYAAGPLLCFGKLASAIGFEHAAHFTTCCKRQQFMKWVVYARQTLHLAPQQETKEAVNESKADATPFVCRHCQSPMTVSALTLPAFLPRAPLHRIRGC